MHIEGIPTQRETPTERLSTCTGGIPTGRLSMCTGNSFREIVYIHRGTPIGRLSTCTGGINPYRQTIYLL